MDAYQFGTLSLKSEAEEKKEEEEKKKAEEEKKELADKKAEEKKEEPNIQVHEDGTQVGKPDHGSETTHVQESLQYKEDKSVTEPGDEEDGGPMDFEEDMDDEIQVYYEREEIE